MSSQDENLSIAEFNKKIMEDWNAARTQFYLDRGLQCLNCNSSNLKATKKLVGDDLKLLGVCQDCRDSSLELKTDDKFQDDCVYRSQLKLSEKR